MKYILILVLFFSITSVNAQTQTSYTATSIAAMKAYYGSANRIYIPTLKTDYVICSPCTADEVTIFAGAGGRKWEMVYAKNVKDSFAITNTVTLDAFPTLGNVVPATSGGTRDKFDSVVRVLNSIYDSLELTQTVQIAAFPELGVSLPASADGIRKNLDSVVGALLLKQASSTDLTASITKATATWAAGAVSVNSNTARHDILITATGARTLSITNITTTRNVVIWIDNTSGATVVLTLPTNSFVQNTTTGVYTSAASVTLAQGKTALVLSNYDGTNYWFNY